jgi:AcrR family transcriptional regulator
MSGAARRELIVTAATRCFAEQGYAATTTDTVAREAGVSQPYVVRMFGTKLQLFLEVFQKASDRIVEAFERELDAHPFDPERTEDWTRLGQAYQALAADRDFLLVMMHGFTSAGVEEIGQCARAGMGQIYALLRRTGGTEDQLRSFIAHGMLVNIMVAMRAPEHAAEGGPLAELTACAFKDYRPTGD